MKKQSKHTMEERAQALVQHLSEDSQRVHETNLTNTERHARTLAEQGKPGHEDSLRPYMEEIIGFYTQQRSDFLLRLRTGKLQLQADLRMNKIQRQLEAEETTLIREMSNAKDKRADYNIEYSLPTYILFHVAMTLLMILECIWFVGVFSTILRDNNSYALAGGILLSVVTIYLIKFVTLELRDNSMSSFQWGKTILFIVYICFLGFVAFGIGIIRYVAVLHNASESDQALLGNPFVFVVLSSVTMAGTAGLIKRYALSAEDKNKWKKRRKLEKEIRHLEKLYANNRIEQEALHAKGDDAAKSQVIVEEGEKSLKMRFDGYLKQAVGVFRRENLRNRNDVPKCISEEVETLSNF